MRKRTCGIYCIKNMLSGKVYIGQSIDVVGRWYGHRKELREGKHTNSYLQYAWNADGEDFFTFSTIEEVEREKLSEREQFWIDQHGGTNSDSNYNLLDARTNSPNEETRRKISRSRIGISMSDETKEKLRQANLGQTAWNKGRQMAEGTKEKLRQINLGKPAWNKGKQYMTDEQRQHLSALNTGKQLPEAVRDMLLHHAKNQTPEVTAKRLKSREGYTHSEETRQKLRIPCSEEKKRKISEAKKGKKRTKEKELNGTSPGN